MTSKVSINRKRGNTRRIIFHIEVDSGDVDVSNFTEFKLSVNPSQYPTTADGTTEEMAGYVIDGPTGRIGFTPSGDIPVGAYFFDATVKDDNAEQYTIVEGTYVVTQGITK